VRVTQERGSRSLPRTQRVTVNCELSIESQDEERKRD
jgi:hypothetical protein